LRGYFPGEPERRPPRRAHPPQGGRPLPSPGAPAGPGEPTGPTGEPQGAPAAESPPADGGRRGWRGLEWAIGIALGLLLGIAIVVAFLFFGSEDTIDAPKIDRGAQQARERQAPTAPPQRTP
jgi:hypothetical protein